MRSTNLLTYLLTNLKPTAWLGLDCRFQLFQFSQNSEKKTEYSPTNTNKIFSSLIPTNKHTKHLELIKEFIYAFSNLYN